MNRRDFLVGCTGLTLTAAFLPKLKSERVVFRAPLIQGNIPNKNGHIYPRSVLEEIAKQQGDQEIPGTIGFNWQSSFECKTVIPFREMSHMATELRVENDCLTAKIRILDTPRGKELIELIKNGDIAFRTGGIGAVSTAMNSEYQVVGQVVQKGFKLFCVAAVAANDAA